MSTARRTPLDISVFTTIKSSCAGKQSSPGVCTKGGANVKRGFRISLLAAVYLVLLSAGLAMAQESTSADSKPSTDPGVQKMGKDPGGTLGGTGLRTIAVESEAVAIYTQNVEIPAGALTINPNKVIVRSKATSLSTGKMQIDAGTINVGAGKKGSWAPKEGTIRGWTAILLQIGLAWWENHAGKIHTLVLVATLVWVARYTYYTRKLAETAEEQRAEAKRYREEAQKQTSQAQEQTMQAKTQTEILRRSNNLDTIHRILDRLASDESREARGFVNNKFKDRLDIMLKNRKGQYFATAEEFNKWLEHQFGPKDVEFIERALNDFDRIAVPLFLGYESLWPIAKTYREVLKKTSEVLLMFVRYQKTLRGAEGKLYKMHYLYLLNELKISLPEDLQPPENPKHEFCKPLKAWSDERAEYVNPMQEHDHLFGLG